MKRTSKTGGRYTINNCSSFKQIKIVGRRYILNNFIQYTRQQAKREGY